MSFSITDIQRALAEGMFGGDYSLAGMAIFTVLMIIIFAAFAKKNILVPFAVMLPMAVMFNLMGIMASSLSILLSLVSVIVIATKAKEAL